VQLPLINVPFSAWPVPSAKSQTLYLSEDFKLSDQAAPNSAVVSYKADVPVMQIGADPEEISFCYTFEGSCTILGCSRAVLYMSTHESDDMDVFVQFRKADKYGKLLEHINIPLEDREKVGMTEVEPLNPLIYLGPIGSLRASYRTLESSLSNTFWPEHDFIQQEKLKPGEVVKMEIGLWQTGMQFEAGEKLIVKIAGHNMTLAEWPGLRGAMPIENKGEHHLHFGGDYSSHIIIPTVKLPSL
jgi:predicted acyl esterase